MLTLVSSARVSRLARAGIDHGGLLCAVALAVYGALATPHIVDGDNAEYSALGTIGGAAHPTGYPLYLMWLRAMAWLPGTPAHAASLATAMLAAACVLALHAACRAWGARPLAATVAVAIFAASPLVMRVSTQAEVFALNNLVVATILWLAADGPVRGIWRAGALGLVAGLGLSDHVTCVLVAPVGIVGVVRAVREAEVRWQAIALAVAGLVLGLTPYVYLAVTAENPMSWGRHLDSFHAVLGHFLRNDYGGPGAFAPDPQPIPASQNLLALAAMLGRTWLWAPLAIGVVALVDRLRRPHDGSSRWAWAMLAVSFVVAGPLLVSRFDVTHEGPGLYVIQRFFFLPALLLAIPIAVGIDWLIGTRVLATRPALGVGLVVGLFVAIAGTSLPYVQGVHSPAVEQGVRNVLHSLPENSVAVVYEDDLNFGAGYVQLVLHERPDVVVAMSTAVGLPRNRERLEQRLGIRFPATKVDRLGVGFATDVLASGRALFVDALATDILAAFPNYPHGALFRVLPRGTPRPPIHDIFTINKALYEAFALDYAVPRLDADWPVHVHVRYVQMWQIIGDELAAAGQRDDAAIAYDIGRALAPKP